MEKRIFLTGADAAERGGLLREALGGLLAGAGGFVMEAELSPEGFAEGYALRPAAAAGGVEGLPARRFLDCRVWPPRQDNEVFRSFGVTLLEEAVWYPCAVLDELGGTETLIPQFREALYALLESGVPLAGALKTPEEAERWRELYGLGERLTLQTQALRRALDEDAETRIIDLDAVPREEAAETLRAWALAFISPRGA